MFRRCQAAAHQIRRHLDLYRLALRDPRTPWLPRLLLILALAYLASPIDLLPDFIPVLGQLDDLLLVPALVWLALRLIPAAVLADCRQRAGLPPAAT
ncbi:MAG: DUF1232 domain-containing protein [Lentisphaeria bacterium]|jgi:uncharacterized membrane protein YkvA (DUF1232 family)